jgi:hypothetical protein
LEVYNLKKSTRILAILMAFAMLIGSFSVMGNAYQAYKNDGIEKYNDVDAPVFNLEQYATMALDEIDRMLAKEQISLNIYIGVLNLGSVTETIASVESLLSSVSTLLPLPSAMKRYSSSSRRIRQTIPASLPASDTARQPSEPIIFTWDRSE